MIREWFKDYHGVFTEKGKMWCYRRIHSAQLGFMDGLDPRREYRLDYWMERHEDVDYKPHYYDTAHFIGSWLKFPFVAVMLYLFTILGVTEVLVNALL